MLNRTVMLAKHQAPESLRVVGRRIQQQTHNTRLRLTVPVTERSEFTNIYHCAVRKTASQWIKELFSDPIVYRHSGLVTYDPRFYNWSHPRICPPDRIALSLFFPRRRFDRMPKPEKYRAFYVYRDPRDMVVSSYFSTRNSHGVMGDVLEVRQVLQELPKKEGMLYLVDHLAEKNTFKAIRSWASAPPSPEVRLFRYEDLTGEKQAEQVDQLMRHCGIVLPEPELEELLSRYSFSRMNDRKGAGKVSHYRKGAAGDWQNHFDDDISAAFDRATGNLVQLLGYSEAAPNSR